MGFGELGAKGIEGGRALAEGLEYRTFDTDVEWVRSPEERLQQAVKYLSTKSGAAAVLRTHHITTEPAALTAWLTPVGSPSRDEQRRLEQAFRDLRRRNIAPYSPVI